MAYNVRLSLNHKTRKFLRQATEDWKQECLRKANYTCFVTGKTRKNGNKIILTAHHCGDHTFNSIVKAAHKNLHIQYRELTNQYQPGELNAVLEEVKRLHKEGVEGICLEKEVHDKIHKLYGKNVTMDQIREFRRNYRRSNYNSRNGVYKSKRSA